MVRERDDEHTPFERPKRRTKPRTKDRPNYDDAAVARVVTIDRGRYTVTLDDRTITAMKSRNLGRKGVVVGDEARVVGDISGDEGSLARIVEVLPRRTVLRRSADDDDPIERIIVANADQLVIVAALADPPPRAGLIDRCLVAAYDARMEPLVCLTKADLGAPDEILALFEPLGVRVVVTQKGGDLGAVREVLRDRTSVLVGHSGVGKSTLVNALVPDAHRSVSYVNAVTGRGRHTSTSAISSGFRSEDGSSTHQASDPSVLHMSRSTSSSRPSLICRTPLATVRAAACTRRPSPSAPSTRPSLPAQFPTKEWSRSGAYWPA